MVLGIKNSGSGVRFLRKSGKTEKPISRQNNQKICLEKYSNFHVENRRKMIALKFKDPVTYYLLRRKGRATSKNVEGAQPPLPDSGFSR